MTIENSEYTLASDDSVLLSMDNIALQSDAMDDVEQTAEATAAVDSDDQIVVSEVIQVKLQQLLQPFVEYPAGQDPRYGDEFVLIKAEIDKLAFNDYNAVLTLAGEILKNEGKDLRVAGYYLLASAYLHGLKGLLEGLQLYRLLLEQFGDCIYPERDDAQRIALQWLNNNKLLAYARQHQKNATRDNMEKLEQELDLLNEAIMARFNDETLRLTIINNWLKETKKQLVALEQEITAAKEPQPTVQNIRTQADEQSPTILHAKTSQTPSLVGEFTRSDNLSETELYTFMRKIANQLLNDKDYQRAVAYARAARWGGMILPPNNNGKTALTPPRQSGVNEVTRNLQQGEFDAAFKLCEALFFEMGGHMLLDLQCYASKAAKAMGKHDLANLIVYETAALLQRFPEFQTLRFDDDTAFANAETLAWLNSAAGKKEVAPIIGNDEDDQELMAAINHSCEVANEEGLTEALAGLAEYRPRNKKQRFQLRLAMAQLCLDHGRAEYALPILEELNEQAERTSLAAWDKRLALVVAKTLQSALRGVMLEATEEDKARYGRQIKNLSAQMCRWDLVQAVQLI
jgi:type VI secretion system protein VasJ